jgi:hypothetical protein
MTAATGSNGARDHIQTGGGFAHYGRPDHLVVWLNGHIQTGDDQVIDDGRLEREFSLDEWVAEVRDAYPQSIVAATFPPHRMDGAAEFDRHPDDDWLELTRVAAGIDVGGDQRSFTGDTTPTSLRSLRRWATGRLEERNYSVDDIVLALSELSTNVERHGGEWLTVDLVDRGHSVVLAVTDPAHQRLPQPRFAGPNDTTGRGLLVVATLAMNWGLVVRAAHKTVWAAFPGAT